MRGITQASSGARAFHLARLLRIAALIFISSISVFPLAAQIPDISSSGLGSTGGISRRGRYTVSGTVRDAEDQHAVDGVEVQLWTLASGMAATTVSGVNGGFTFADVPNGTYRLVVSMPGYQRLEEDLNFNGRPPVAIQLTLNRDPGYGGPKIGSGPTVSTRDLSIPRRAREAMERGLKLMNEKADYKGSIAEFQRAAREYPKYYEAHLQMGVAYLKMSDAAKAEQSFRTSIEMSERKYPDALVHLAGMYSDQQRFADAEPLAREAVQINPLDPSAVDAYQELSRALHGMDREEEAEAAALEAVRVRPDDPQTYLILANIHLKTRDYAGLVRDLDSFLQIAPNHPQAPQARQLRAQVVERLANAQAPPQ